MINNIKINEVYILLDGFDDTMSIISVLKNASTHNVKKVYISSCSKKKINILMKLISPFLTVSFEYCDDPLLLINNFYSANTKIAIAFRNKESIDFREFIPGDKTLIIFSNIEENIEKFKRFSDECIHIPLLSNINSSNVSAVSETIMSDINAKFERKRVLSLSNKPKNLKN